MTVCVTGWVTAGTSFCCLLQASTHKCSTHLLRRHQTFLSVGELDAAGLRCSAAAKVAYPNRDTYFGGYSNDAKSGVGLYVFANGGAYIGQYQQGKRHGQGLMILPDGAMYRGGFDADKFDGQVGLHHRLQQFTTLTYM